MIIMYYTSVHVHNYAYYPCIHNYYVQSLFSTDVIEREVPSDMIPLVESKRHELIESVANVDEQLCDLFLNDEMPSPEQLRVREREKERRGRGE